MALLPGLAFAGGGPENVLLVVNRNDTDSMTIANHFIELRKIPPSNVVTLSWEGDVNGISVDDFRNKLLSPVLSTIARRKLQSQIDYVIYSSGFPWAVRLSGDIRRFTASMKKTNPSAKWPKTHCNLGSLSGMTFLGEATVLGLPWYFDGNSNYYACRSPRQKEPTVAFSRSYGFGPGGERVDGRLGRKYYISTMLGVTTEAGNTVEEVLNYLARAAGADGTKPRGTIYYVQNKDIRTTVRTVGLPFTVPVRALKAMGVEAEIVQGKLPVKRDDVQGLMTGTAAFNWKSSGSTILPGAICENFTSWGGVMSGKKNQTLLSVFLRYGAAGSSGTVSEPFAIKYKFPDPMIQVHYARGCTLGEAFYQSVAGPYQLLIVGDPLCRPWANIPQVQVEGVEPMAVVKGKLTLKPSATILGRGKVDHFDLFVDGLRTASCGVDESLELDTAKLGDGYHRLRVVAFENSLIRSQGRWIAPIVTNNHGRTIRARTSSRGIVAGNKPMAVEVDSPGSKSIALLHNSRLLGVAEGPSAKLLIRNPSSLGHGPVELRAVGIGDRATENTYAWAKPIRLTITKAGAK